MVKILGVSEINDREVVNIVGRMRIGDKIRRNGEEYYIINGHIGDREIKSAGDLIEYDESLKEYITKSPREFITKAIKGNALLGDVYSAYKYLVAVKNQQYDLAKQTEIAWRGLLHLLNDNTRRILGKALYNGEFWDFRRWASENQLFVKDMPRQISQNPPIHVVGYEDKDGKEYLSFSSINAGWDYGAVILLPKDELNKESMANVVDTVKLAYYQHMLFTGMGKVLEQGWLGDNIFYALINYLNYDIVKDEATNEYEVRVGADVNDHILPILVERFPTYEEAKKFLKEEVINKYFEFERKFEQMLREAEKQESKDLGGMYV